jgi:release factor glutamine methyltransferase
MLAWAAASLRASSPTPRLDAELLLAHVCQCPRTALLARATGRGGERLNAAQAERFEALVARRAAGEPIAYLTGRREFWSLEFEVSPATLIPRPETELLVERALTRLPPDAPWRIADLGTGCGAIAAALARERPQAHIVATDISGEALAVAQRNFERLGLANIELRQGDWLAAFSREERFEMIVSNPPYVASGDPLLTTGALRFEPLGALAAGPDGLDAIRRIALHARGHLVPGGWLLLEHGAEQGGAVAALARRYGYVDITTYRDLAGHERVCEARARHTAVIRSAYNPTEIERRACAPV